MKFDAVIVLANEMDENGKLNSESRLRANFAASLFEQHKIPLMITCGWAYRRDTAIPIAESFKNYLIEMGVQNKQILSDTNSRDTVGDAFFTRLNICEPLGLKSILVITSNYHVIRTKEIFDFVYGDKFKIRVEGIYIEISPEILEKEEESRVAFNKTFAKTDVGNVEQIYHTLQSSHPYYNGDKYPKIKLQKINSN